MSHQMSLLDEAPVSDPLPDVPALLALLDDWVALGWLRELDRAMAMFLLDLDENCTAPVMLAAALASHQLGRGHSCVDLARVLEQADFVLSLPPEGRAGVPDALLPSQLLQAMTLNGWLAALHASPVVAAVDGNAAAPLVLHAGRLYLRRFWRYERAVAADLVARLALDESYGADAQGTLQRLFADAGNTTTQRVDWQKVACAMAAMGNFTIITGGPGTGKTTTVVRLLALLQETAMAGGDPLRIHLAAPTGKAAARLTESIGGQVQALPVSEAVRAAIPMQVTTVHRLLGAMAHSRRFRHHAGNPLALDVLVVDEASMLGLEMTHDLLEALPRSARLILLGDKDQLASVEAGALLGDLCRDAEGGFYAPGVRTALEQASGEVLDDPALQPGTEAANPLAQRTVMLRHSHRFGPDSGIGQLAHAVNRGDDRAALSLLDGHRALDHLVLRDSADAALHAFVLDGRRDADGTQAAGYRHYLNVLRDARPGDQDRAEGAWQDWAAAVLRAFDDFQLLCAVRQGPWGTLALNEDIAAQLHDEGLIARADGWYEGRPVMVTRNDYSLGLMNGDIGIALLMPDHDAAGNRTEPVLRVAFPGGDAAGGLRYFLPSRLSQVETVYAMTVHKSQGSEFSHTALMLPDTLSPVLSRELVYTGITRARRHFSLLEGRAGMFRQAVQRRVERFSGLVDGMLAPGGPKPSDT